jgi:hypothetical protein
MATHSREVDDFWKTVCSRKSRNHVPVLLQFGNTAPQQEPHGACCRPFLFFDFVRWSLESKSKEEQGEQFIIESRFRDPHRGIEFDFSRRFRAADGHIKLTNATFNI